MLSPLLSRILKYVVTIARYLALVGAAGWCMLVLTYSPILPVERRAIATVAVGLLLLFTIIRPALFRIPFILCFLTVVFFWQRITPTNDADWQPDLALSPWVEQSGDDLTFHNVRDVYYRTETDFDVRYVTKKVKLSDFSSVDMFTVYWGPKDLAHIIMSFGFADKDYIAVSIEARKTKQQAYSTTDGFFRNFHLMYVVAEERDLIGLRTLHRKPPEDVYLFRGAFNRERNTSLLLHYIKKINQLREEPAFYNTLTSNCTTQVLQNAQPGNPLLKYNWRILLSGHTPEYLYMLGMLDTTQPLERLVELGYVNPRTQNTSDSAAFSQEIRRGVPRPVPDQATTSR